MKRIHLIIYSTFLILNSAFSQSGTWTWISGTDSINARGVHGTQGVPSINNHPPGLYGMAQWKDKLGNFWIYGGDGPLALSDLWKYDPITNEWTWMKGDGAFDDHPVFGTKGVSNPSNTPGWRVETVPTWVDSSGALWLFSGYNWGNNLWKYDIGSNEWAWVTGDTILDSKGVYGTQGLPSALNIPGSRYVTCSAWTDSLNNLWLFGGLGYGKNDTLTGTLNDLWKYNITTNEWTWMKGSDTLNVPANYGTEGVPAASNDPGGRWTYTKWKDVQGNFWLMGGGTGDSGPIDALNDVWKYDLSLNEWIWMNGPDVVNNLGDYDANCIFNSINMPQSRISHSASTADNCGRFWLFGGQSDNYGSGNYNFNDLWVFNPQQLKWNWINGTGVPNQPGNYGMLGVASSSNMPSSRGLAAAWWGNDNKFYMFGGLQTAANAEYADLWVYTPDTNCVPASTCNSVLIAPVVANFQSSQTTLCANDCINFTDLSTNATSWQWSFAGATDSASTAQNPQGICYANAGTYNVTLVASNAGGSDWVTLSNYIHVNPAPPTPNIIQVRNTLYCITDPSYTSYQWSFDSIVIVGATDTSYVATQNGDYNVQVSNEDGCKISAGINIIIGIQNYAKNNIISLYPNPAGNQLTIHDSQFTIKNIAIYNVLGVKVYFQQLPSPNSQLSTTIDVSDLSSGVYFVQVSDGTQSFVSKFVKE